MIIALVPLRGGSKSIPGKNIKPLAGQPLCAWALKAAFQSGIFERLIVSTDSEEIAGVVKTIGIPLEVIMRPAEYATDTATTESVMLHAAARVDFEVMATIQATSPLTRPVDFAAAYDQFRKQEADSLVACVRLKRFFWSDEGQPINYDPLNRPMRQQFKGTLWETGAFYFTKRRILEEYRCRLGGKIAVYELPQDTAVDIDEPEDWEHLERIMVRRQGAVEGA
jgi:CMP-N-acetylneuraminic acid synthetase